MRITQEKQLFFLAKGYRVVDGAATLLLNATIATQSKEKCIRQNADMDNVSGFQTVSKR